MEKKNCISLLLAAVMLFTVAVCGTGTALAENTAPVAAVSPVDQQLNLIYSQLDKMMQQDSQNTWYYCVTDLDHDGNLEFVAAALHPQDRSTNLKVWEVSEDKTALIECGLSKDEDESFPDIMTESADAFYNRETNTWSYLVYDNIVISDTEVYTIQTAVSLKDGVLGYDAYAVEHTVLENAYRNVSYSDPNGFPISQEQYSRYAFDTFAGMERSNAAFEWLTAENAMKLTSLADSYAVFTGTKEPTETFPVPKPAALAHPEATPVPVATAQPAPTPKQDVFLMITKNPTNENRKIGTNAVFVACANAFESLTWTFVSPEGGEYTPRNFVAGSGAGLSGENSTTITVTGVESWMNGWAVYCTFYYKGQVARTSYAYININSPAPVTPTPTPEPKTKAYYGNVCDWAYDAVGVYIDGVGDIYIPWNITNLQGEVYIGARAIVYWTGRVNDLPTYCEIMGSEPAPEPVYGSMNGIAHHGNAFEIYIELSDGSNIYVNGLLVNIIGGMDIEGAPCTVYYTYIPTPENIYQVDVYGYDVVYPDEIDDEDDPFIDIDEDPYEIYDIPDEIYDIPDEIYDIPDDTYELPEETYDIPEETYDNTESVQENTVSVDSNDSETVDTGSEESAEPSA